MNIGIASVTPYAQTGYGRVVREVSYRLLDAHNVVCFSYESDVMVWGGKKLYVFPDGRSVPTLPMANPLTKSHAAAEMTKTYCKKHGIDLLIGHWDAWALKFLEDAGIPFLVYIPVDGPMNRKWANYVEKANRVVLYSKYGYEQCLDYFPPSKLAYIEHGVDTSVFRPLKLDKADLRKSLDLQPPIPEDAFLFTYTGANVGERKNIPLLMRTFARFAKDHKDAHLCLHANPIAVAPEGYDLPMLIDMLGMKGRVHLPKFDPILEPATDDDLNRLYNASDVFVSNSEAEGFGLPILEAQSSGLPVIAPDTTSQIELVEGHGWFVDTIDIEDYARYTLSAPTLQENAVPSQKSLLLMMEDAYKNEKRRRKYSRDSRRFALGYDWSKIAPKWNSLLDEVAVELKMFGEVSVPLR